MRILHLVSSAGFYGLEAVVLNLSVATRDLGHNVSLAVFHNEHNPHLELADRALAAGLDVHLVPCRGQLDWSARNEIRNLVDSLQLDILHSHGYKADLYAAAAWSRRHSGLVATAHNWTNASPSLRLYAFLDQNVLRRFDRVICVSDQVRSTLLARGLRSSRLSTIPNGIDTQRFTPCNSDCSRSRPLTLGMVGRLVPEKGFHLVLQAGADLLRRHPDVRFRIVGTGPYGDSLRQLAQQLGSGDHVDFAGEQRDMPSVYRSIDLLILPSFNEGLPMVILEAMSSGIPVLATRVGGIPSVIEHGCTGWLVEPQDVEALRSTLEGLLDNRAHWPEIGAAARDWVVRNRSIQSTAEMYVNDYRDVLSTS